MTLVHLQLVSFSLNLIISCVQVREFEDHTWLARDSSFHFRDNNVGWNGKNVDLTCHIECRGKGFYFKITCTKKTAISNNDRRDNVITSLCVFYNFLYLFVIPSTSIFIVVLFDNVFYIVVVSLNYEIIMTNRGTAEDG